jgi:hypothetical protein
MLSNCNVPVPPQVEVTDVAAGRTWYFDGCLMHGHIMLIIIDYDANVTAQVEVTDTAAGRTWYFEADCWLDAAAAKGAATRRAELLLTASNSNPMADRKTYQVGANTAEMIELIAAQVQSTLRCKHFLRTGCAHK